MAHVPKFDDHDVVGGLVAWGELDVRSLGSISRTASHRIALRFSSNRSSSGMSAQSSHVCCSRGRLGLISLDKLHDGGRMAEENVYMGDGNELYRIRNFSAVDFDGWRLGSLLSKFV